MSNGGGASACDARRRGGVGAAAVLAAGGEHQLDGLSLVEGAVYAARVVACNGAGRGAAPRWRRRSFGSTRRHRPLAVVSDLALLSPYDDVDERGVLGAAAAPPPWSWATWSNFSTPPAASTSTGGPSSAGPTPSGGAAAERDRGAHCCQLDRDAADHRRRHRQRERSAASAAVQVRRRGEGRRRPLVRRCLLGRLDVRRDAARWRLGDRRRRPSRRWWGRRRQRRRWRRLISISSFTTRRRRWRGVGRLLGSRVRQRQRLVLGGRRRVRGQRHRVAPALDAVGSGV